MKKTMILTAVLLIGLSLIREASAEIKYIGGYTRSNGTYVGGHYRDTSNDGNPYNNANYFGYND